jgi:peptidoglycan/LPS O-acetylase OafA/YrhL
MKYRRDIDGLRAIAVLSVIFYHAGFEAFSGGYVGVDVFFVISGYLITSIILNQIKEGNFSLSGFYERRAKRILPALFLVMFFTIPFAWVSMSPAELQNYSKSLAAIPLFVSNIFFWRDGGYFETAAELKPLLHTWSLAVEEQYYIFLPLIFLTLWRFGVKAIIAVLVLFFCGSLVFAEWAVNKNPAGAFFLLPSRAWELILGSLSAFFLAQKTTYIITKFKREFLGWLGIGLIFYSVFYFEKTTSFPGVFALIPTIGTVLFILFSTEDTTISNFASNRVFVGVGLISYSAYLWHQPIFSFSRYLKPSLDIFEITFLLLLVLIISFLTWRFVENPIRKSPKINRRITLIAACLASIFFICIGMAISKINHNIESKMAEILSVNNAIYSQNINERKFVRARILNEREWPREIIIGSSRLMQVGSNILSNNVLNLSVSGASIEDVVAIWGMSAKNINPQVYYIGADPWLFNINSDQKRWKTLEQDYFDALKQLQLPYSAHSSLFESSPFYNEVALDVFNATNKRDIVASELPEKYSDKILKDGRRVYNTIYANKSSDEITRGLSVFLNYSMSNFEFSKNSQHVLELIFATSRKNSKIVLVLVPYHPNLYSLMKNKNHKVIQMEAFFKEISAKHSVEIIGSYDPDAVGCKESEFFDGLHPKDTCMARLFKNRLPM